MPVFSIIFGNLMNSFGQNLNDPEQLQQQVCFFGGGGDCWGGGQEEGGAQGGQTGGRQRLQTAQEWCARQAGSCTSGRLRVGPTSGAQAELAELLPLLHPSTHRNSFLITAGE